jgi:hypothetical protein
METSYFDSTYRPAWANWNRLPKSDIGFFALYNNFNIDTSAVTIEHAKRTYEYSPNGRLINEYDGNIEDVKESKKTTVLVQNESDQES